MGEAKNKKKRFLNGNPNCCFCGGIHPATTIDHVPPRTCFPDRIGPEGFEFPACGACQSVSRLDELAFGFFVQLIDPDAASYSEGRAWNALVGLKNNLPHLVPDFDLRTAEKRRFLKEYDIPKPFGQTYAELPIARIPDEVHEHVLRYARKIACALFYREMGKAAPVDYYVWATWSQGANAAHMRAWRNFVEMTPLITRGGRTNLDFGDRFGYRCNKKAMPDLFAGIVQFGTGMALAMSVVNPEARDRLDHSDWVAVGDIYSR